MTPRRMAAMRERGTSTAAGHPLPRLQSPYPRPKFKEEKQTRIQ
jgi:hypothetical protein